MADLGLLLIRLIVGLSMAAHGSQKLFGWFGGYGISGTGGFLESIGIKPGKLMAALAGLGEFASGLLLAAGLFTPYAGVLLALIMLVAALKVHVAKGFFAQNGGYELTLLYATAGVGLALIGPGSYTLLSLVK
jgi:putative oxidoreductase